MKITFFKMPKHRVFNYSPLYYDSAKEELDERVRKIQEGLEKNDDGEYKIKRERFSFRTTYLEKKRSEAKWKGKRYLVYLTVALFVCALCLSAYNFIYLINSENYENRTEKNEKKSPDWDFETQFTIVDDDDIEITENISE